MQEGCGPAILWPRKAERRRCGLPLWRGSLSCKHGLTWGQEKGAGERPLLGMTTRGFLCSLGHHGSFLILEQLQDRSCCSVTKLCPTPCDPMDCSTPGFPDIHYLLKFTQIHVHRVSDAIQPSHLLWARLTLALNPYKHQGLFQ